MNKKYDILKLTQRLLIVLSLLISVFACRQKNNSGIMLNHLLADTLNLQLEHVEIQIDSMNSGISRNLKEILPIRDSIQINFDGYFYGTPVILIHNEKNLYQDTLETDESLGWSSSVKFKRNKKENFFELRIDGKRYQFTELNYYNFIHISDVNKDLEIVYANKGYIYD